MPPEGNRRGKQCSECLSTDHYKRDCPNIIATRERSGHSAPTPAAVRVQHQHQPGLQQSIVSCSTVGFAAAERGLIRGRLGCSIALPKSLRFGPSFSWLQLYSTGDCTRKTIRRDGDNLVLCENCHGIVLGAGAFPYYDNSFPYRDIILERPEDFDLYEVQLQELLRASRPAPPPGPQQLAGRRERRSRSRSRDRRWRSPSREQRGGRSRSRSPMQRGQYRRKRSPQRHEQRSVRQHGRGPQQRGRPGPDHRGRGRTPDPRRNNHGHSGGRERQQPVQQQPAQ
jgi:hypothetical protein